MNYELVPFTKEFYYKKQRRKKPAKQNWKQEYIAGSDFETKDGYPHILTWTVYRNGNYVDYHTVFGGTALEPEMFLEANGGKKFPPFTIENFCYTMKETGISSQGGSKKKGGKQRKRKTPPQLYFYNLSFDASAMIKTLPDNAIAKLMLGEDVVIDCNDYTLAENIERSKDKSVKGWVLNEDGKIKRISFNRYIRLAYLHKKFFELEPLNYYSNGERWGKVSCWDIKQFLGGGSLDFNAKKHLNEGKIDFDKSQMNLLGSLTQEGIKFTNDNWDKILEYAEKDSNLTARLAWKTINEFESNGVRMVKPFSPAAVAERAAYDCCNIPSMDSMMKYHESTMRAFWEGYQGGWFESVGQGVANCYAQDITSAYPHVMWWLPDITDGLWIGTFNGSKSEDSKEYLEKGHKLYRPSIFEAEVIFPKDKIIYPASKKSELAGCLMNARINYGWFTGDEIKEFEKWGAKIDIVRWSAFIPNNDNEVGNDVENGIRYPFRPFVERFYGMKLEQDELKISNPEKYDAERRSLAKLMCNSLYGKNCQAVSKGEINQTGQMWNPVYAAVITAGCRMRIAEIIRKNGYDSILSVATDGVIFDATKGTVIVPNNPAPVYFDGKLINLGDWEDDGSGLLMLMMSGVYSVIKGIKAKTTFRGTYSLFQDRFSEDGERYSNLYGTNWYDFCDRYKDQKIVIRNIDNNPAYRPYSIGEAKMKKDYRLVNRFRVVDCSITPNGDSNKRKWKTQPKTFGELLDKWWVSDTWESMI